MLIFNEGGIIYMAKSARTKKSTHPSESVVIQFGVAFIVVMGFAILMYAVKYFLPNQPLL